MEQVKNVTLLQNETKSLIFEFKRAEFDIKNWLNTIGGDITSTVSGSHHFGEESDPLKFVAEDADSLSNGTCSTKVRLELGKQYVWLGGYSDCTYCLISKLKFDGSQYEMSYKINLEISAPVGSGFGTYFEAEAGVKSGNISLDSFPKNITGFDDWYVQYDISGFYPNIVLSESTPWPTALFCYTCCSYYNVASGYYIHLLPTNKNYIQGTLSCYPIFGYQWVPNLWNYTYTPSDSRSGTLNKVKMSSVPYDFDGKAI